MFRYIVKRTIYSFLTLFMILIFVFFAARVSGSPIEVMYPDGLEPGQLEQYNEKYGLDQNYAEQFRLYLVNIAQGDFGDSIIERRPVTEIIFARAVETLKLGIWAFGVSVIAGILLGIFTALYRENIIAKFFNQLMSILYAVPGFIIAIFLMLFFSFHFNILPSQGGGTPAHYIMPVICLSIGPAISIARHVRNGILETINQDYIRTAVAKGVGRKVTIFKHAFRNALIPTLTQIGIVIVDIISGSMVIETIFSWPGVGSTLVNSVLDRDFPVIQFTIIFIAFIIIFVNYLLDILYMVVDPRIGKGGLS